MAALGMGVAAGVHSAPGARHAVDGDQRHRHRPGAGAGGGAGADRPAHRAQPRRRAGAEARRLHRAGTRRAAGQHHRDQGRDRAPPERAGEHVQCAPDRRCAESDQRAAKQAEQPAKQLHGAALDDAEGCGQHADGDRATGCRRAGHQQPALQAADRGRHRFHAGRGRRLFDRVSRQELQELGRDSAAAGAGDAGRGAGGRAGQGKAQTQASAQDEAGQGRGGRRQRDARRDAAATVDAGAHRHQPVAGDVAGQPVASGRSLPRAAHQHPICGGGASGEVAGGEQRAALRGEVARSPPTWRLRRRRRATAS